jgi:S1-C subfamily serine protease
VRQRAAGRVLLTGALVAGAMALAAPAASTGAVQASAQDTRAAAREVIKSWQEAVVNVRVVLKMRMSMSGREVQSMDESVDTVGTVIDPSGLTVLSLGSLNPGGMMNKIMSSVGGSAGPQMQMTTEPTDVKIRLSDGQELPAKIVLRDEDLDLAFLRPTAAPAKPLVAVKLDDSGKPAILDEVLVLSRLGRVGGWTAAAALHGVGAIIEKPRTFFVLDGNPSAMGTPAFLPSGKMVGLLTLRQVEAGRSGMFAMMGGTESLGLLPVILPAADVMEIAKQAPAK